MEQDETPLERAWLHVIEGEAQELVQLIRLGELVYQRKDTTEVEAVLAVLQVKLRGLYAALELEQAKAARRQR